jgi:uncharacterized membrane protein YgcG
MVEPQGVAAAEVSPVLSTAIPLVLGLLVVWLIVNAVMRRQRGGGVRTGDDGFFYRGHRTGTQLRYACRVGGERKTGTLTSLGSAEVFVYTGGTPAEIRVWEDEDDDEGDARPRDDHDWSQGTRPAAIVLPAERREAAPSRDDAAAGDDDGEGTGGGGGDFGGGGSTDTYGDDERADAGGAGSSDAGSSDAGSSDAGSSDAGGADYPNAY